jgi:serine/threonine protein kinase
MNHWQVGYPLQGGKYIIEKVLGYGGAGITYRAQDKVSNKFVAIKTLNAFMQSYPYFEQQQQRFIQEAFLLAKCNHPHVIRIYNVFKEGELWCIIMEYIAGGDLGQYVRYKGALSEEEALGYIQQIGSALTYIHQQGFIHRDVKPANIMLRQNTLEAVLIDFGLARDFSQDKMQTHTNSRTESFAPIEQYEIRAKRGAYTDVYALAATLYYILTLKLPFPAPFLQEGAQLIPPKQHNPKISDRLNNAILKGMELYPENRPQSIQEWLGLLVENASSISSSIKRTLVPSNSPVALATTSTFKKDYIALQQLLRAAQWKEADRETAKIMLKIANREKKGWLDRVHLEEFPCEDLRILNQLWLEASRGHFGFSAQKEIYESLGGTSKYNSQIWRNFCDRVGWRENQHWLSYANLNFSLWAPKGHLPMLGMHFWGFTGWIAAITERLIECQ